MKKYKVIALSALIAAGFTSCDLTEKPTSYYEKDTYFETMDQAKMSVVGIYDCLAIDKHYGQYEMAMPASDDTYYIQGTGTDNTRRDIAHYMVKPTNTWIASIWEYKYLGIDRANFSIAGIEQMTGYEEDSNLKELVAQARFLRAFLAFDLIKYWGDVPFKTTYTAGYEEAFKGYYDAIFGPFPSYVQNGLTKIKALDVETVCNSHGPVLTRGCRLEWAIDRYDEWSRPQKNEVPLIPIFYCSAYGNTGRVADMLRAGILEEIPHADCQIYDINAHDMNFLQGLLNRSDAFGIGSPTINADAVAPVWNLLSHVDAINNRKRPALVFGSYGWSGEAVPNLIARLKGLKSNVFEEGFRTIFVPSEEELQKAKEFGKRFAQSLAK